jgi:thiosulfate oxidation carrier complex protein SoxZ
MIGRLLVPPTVRKGEAFEVRVLVQHPMETGFRRDMNGATIPINIVNRLACRIAGREVMSVDLGSGVAANPYFSFFAVAGEAGTVEVEWTDDRGESGRLSAAFTLA